MPIIKPHRLVNIMFPLDIVAPKTQGQYNYRDYLPHINIYKCLFDAKDFLMPTYDDALARDALPKI